MKTKMATIRKTSPAEEEERRSSEELIPGLPNDVAELCLLRLPYPYTSLARTVSSSWKKAVSSSSFSAAAPRHPHLFVLSSDHRFRALDPTSQRWFPLPPAPPSAHLSPSHLAADSRTGNLFAVGRISSAEYAARENRWEERKPMPNPSFGFRLVSAAAVEGKVVAIGGGGVEIYDRKTGEWVSGAEMPADYEDSSFSAAVLGREVYVTEGWRWPFLTSPRGAVYDVEGDTWRAMRRGMREGWTGVAAAVGGKLVVVSEHGDCPVKVYDSVSDDWRYAGGERFPCAFVRRPFAVNGMGDSEICVVGSGLNVAIGKLVHDDVDGEVSVTWRVIPAPERFRGLTPSTCQLLYA